MLGNFTLVCPNCYEENSLTLNKATGVLKCKECNEIYIDMVIDIEEGKATNITLHKLNSTIIYD